MTNIQGLYLARKKNYQSYIHIGQVAVVERESGFNWNLGEVIIIGTNCHFVDTDQDVEWQCKNWEVPSAVN